MTKSNLTADESNRKGFAERLTQLLDSRSASSFARACGFSQTSMTKYLKGLQEPTRPNLIAIAKEGNVNLEWLMCGTGPMRKGDGATTSTVSAPPQTVEGYPPFVPILVKSKIIGTLLGMESAGEDLPLKVIADRAVELYMEDYYTYFNGEREMPTVEASAEVFESLRPGRRTTTKAG